MAIEFLLNRLKALFVFLLSIIRRALCCLRRRRKSSCDSIPLSTVGVIPNSNNSNKEQDNWDQWEENPVVVVPDRPSPNSIQSKIELYRQQVAKPSDSSDEPQLNFFQDMVPKITKQKKLIVRNSKTEDGSINLSKFAVATERVPTNELETWEDNTAGWEEETVEEFGDPTQALREQRRRERERRLYEQHQKRMGMDYSYRPQPLGEKISS